MTFGNILSTLKNAASKIPLPKSIQQGVDAVKTITTKPIVPTQSTNQNALMVNTLPKAGTQTIPTYTAPKTPTTVASPANSSLYMGSIPTTAQPNPPQQGPVAPASAVSTPNPYRYTPPTPSIATPTATTASSYASPEVMSAMSTGGTPTIPSATAVGTGATAGLGGSTPGVGGVLSQYNDLYKTLLEKSDEEKNAEDALANLEGAYREGQANTEDQRIPLGFITGQQASQERRYTAKAIPLQQRAALAQARRTASLDATKFAIQNLNAERELEQQANKPIVVGDVAYRQNADGTLTALTNKQESTSGGFTLKDAAGNEVRYDSAGNIIARGGGSTPGTSPKAVQQVDTALSAIDALINTPGLSGAVGAKNLSSLFGIKGTPLAGTKEADFVAQLDRLKASLILPALEQMKGLGAMSDIEFKNISNSVAALSTKMTETAFKKELNRVYSTLNEKKDVLTVNQMRADGIPDNVIEQVIGKPLSFSSVGNTSVSTLSQAIARQESSNNYSAVSPAGALGKYQIMPATLKGLGYNVTAQEFLKNKNLQEEAHNKLITQLYSRYGGDTNKILADYYGGPNAAKIIGTPAGDKPQYSGGKQFPSINQYVAQVKSKLNMA